MNTPPGYPKLRVIIRNTVQIDESNQVAFSGALKMQIVGGAKHDKLPPKSAFPSVSDTRGLRCSAVGVNKIG